MSKILYVGNFELPDRNAAAHRVLGIAKSLRDAGNEVYFLNTLNDYNGEGVTKIYEGFIYYECKRPSKSCIKELAKLIKIKIEEFSVNVLIAYNLNSWVGLNVYKYCKINGVKMFGDITEWYSASGNLLRKILIKIDTEIRMRYFNKKIDGLIVISRYLANYYKDQNTITVPPTVDLKDPKWLTVLESKSKKVFVYSGQPGKKERLDLMVKAFADKRFEGKNIELHVIGTDEKKFRYIFNYDEPISERVKFLGRVPHNVAVDECKKAAWSVILREKTRVVQAGFPTKFVESVSCATPVLANDFSNIREYAEKYNLGVIFENQNALPEMLEYVIKIDDEQYAVYKENCKKCKAFDYRSWTIELDAFINKSN